VRLLSKSGLDWTKRYPWIVETARKIRKSRFTLDGEAVVLGVCQSALKFDGAYCLTCRCYPDGAIADDDLMSIDRPRQVAFSACSTRGAVGGSGPT
jgi:hypothetical protein